MRLPDPLLYVPFSKMTWAFIGFACGGIVLGTLSLAVAFFILIGIGETFMRYFDSGHVWFNVTRGRLR